MNNKLSKILLFIATGLFAFAFGWRLGAAQICGDVWLAFRQDSFMGYPVTHVVTGVGLVFMAVGMVKFASFTQQNGEVH